MESIKIIKASGELVDFNRDKLMKSLLKSKASNSIAQKIVAEIEAFIYDGISTAKIYEKAFDKLNSYSRQIASRYKLKKAIMELGPTGFPFENFVGELLKNMEYKVDIGLFVKGNCVQHEVDVVALKGNEHFMIECKFHSKFNIKCSVKIPLYIQARFLDIQEQWVKKPGHKYRFHQGWVVNNTRFSLDAINYAKCVNLKLLGWDYPENNGLKDLISVSGLYPITCLNILKKTEKQKLLNKNIVLCSQLCENSNSLTEIGIKESRQKEILTDANALCNGAY